MCGLHSTRRGEGSTERKGEIGRVGQETKHGRSRAFLHVHRHRVTELGLSGFPNVCETRRFSGAGSQHPVHATPRAPLLF